MILTFKTIAQETERSLQSLWMSLNVQVQPSSSCWSSTGSARPPKEEGENIRNRLISLNKALLRGQLRDVLRLEKLSPSPPKLGRSQRLSPSAVTLEHLVACCQSPSELFLFTFLESDSLHLVY